MNKKEKWEKTNWFLLLVGYWIVGYMGCNWLNQFRSHYYDVGFAFEQNIPFIPGFILGYSLVFISILMLYLVIGDIRVFRQGVVSILLLSTMAFLIFLIFPVQMKLRPDINSWETKNFFDAYAKLFFKVDNPYNAIPSLHVAYPTIATLIVWKTHSKIRWVLLSMAVVTAISVILVKQHYIMDAVAGIAAAALAYAVTIKTEPWWGKWFKPSNV